MDLTHNESITFIPDFYELVYWHRQGAIDHSMVTLISTWYPYSFRRKRILTNGQQSDKGSDFSFWSTEPWKRRKNLKLAILCLTFLFFTKRQSIKTCYSQITNIPLFLFRFPEKLLNYFQVIRFHFNVHV